MKKELEKWIIKNWGERCETEDFEDFPELSPEETKVAQGFCPCCKAWRAFDYLTEFED